MSLFPLNKNIDVTSCFYYVIFYVCSKYVADKTLIYRQFLETLKPIDTYISCQNDPLQTV